MVDQVVHVIVVIEKIIEMVNFDEKKGRILNKNHIIIGVWNGGSHLFNRDLGPGH